MIKILLFSLLCLPTAFAAKEDYATMAKKLETGCAAGDAHQCGDLGALYAQGHLGSGPDFVKAYAQYSKACLGGAAERCLRASYFALRGKGTPVSKPDSEKLLRKGCELKDAESCNSLAIFLLDADANDSGTVAALPPASRKDVYDLINQACGLGSELACKNLVKAMGRKIEFTLSHEAKARMDGFCKNGIVEACPSLSPQ